MPSVYTPASTTSAAAIRADARIRMQWAIHVLGTHPNLTEVQLQATLSDLRDTVFFESESYFRMAANAAGFAVENVVRQHRCGYEHVLLLVRQGIPRNATERDPSALALRIEASQALQTPV